MAKTRAKSNRTRQASKAKPAAKRNTAAKKRNTVSSNAQGSLLQDYFVDALKDIYWAEKALTKALPRMAKAATSSDLKKAFNQHLEVTRKQITRLEKIFKQIGKKAQGKKCEAMQGLIEESESIISDTKTDTFTRDAALIIAAQKVEHYEIASYGGLAQLARTMNKKGIASTLATTLNEEKRTDEQLTRLAERSINEEAATEAGDQSSSTLKESFMTIFS